jgi:hypothetical protein
MTTVDEWVRLKRAADRAAERLDAATADLLPTLAVGQELEGRTAKIIKRDRAVLQPGVLVTHVSDALWRRITERKPVADLYRAEVKRGRLEQSTLDKSSTRSRPWLELR